MISGVAHKNDWLASSVKFGILALIDAPMKPSFTPKLLT